MKSIYLIKIILIVFFCFSCAPRTIVVTEEAEKAVEVKKEVETEKAVEPEKEVEVEKKVEAEKEVAIEKEVEIEKPIKILKPFEPQKPLKDKEPEIFDIDYTLFSEAEKEFFDQSYYQALEKYCRYLSLFPDRPFATSALMKIGAIYSVFGNYAESRKFYMKLIDEYPHNFFVPDAMVEILLTFYNEHKYKEVIRQAIHVIDKIFSKINLIRTYVILGDANMALGFPINAVYPYAIASKELEGPGKEVIIEKLKEAFRQLTIEKIMFLLKYLDDELLQSYLMFQIGIDKIEEKEYSGALNSLSEFIERFPDHENKKYIFHENLQYYYQFSRILQKI